MNILAFETASSVCGVALFIDGKMACKDEINKFKIHGQRLPINRLGIEAQMIQAIGFQMIIKLS